MPKVENKPSGSTTGNTVRKCARFMSNRRESLKHALLRIGRYLMATMEAGIIFKPENDRNMELWFDADFCGNWRVETAHVENQPQNK